MNNIIGEYRLIRNKINTIDTKIIKLKELTKLEMNKIKTEKEKELVLEKFRNNLKIIKNEQYNSLVHKMNKLKKIIMMDEENNNSDHESLSQIDKELKNLKKKYV